MLAGRLLLLPVLARELRRSEGGAFKGLLSSDLAKEVEENQFGVGARLAQHCTVDFDPTMPSEVVSGGSAAMGTFGWTKEGDKWKLVKDPPSDAITSLTQSDAKNGWKKLDLAMKGEAADPRLDDMKQMWQLGFLEGAITRDQIGAFYTNTALEPEDDKKMATVFDAQIQRIDDDVEKVMSEKQKWLTESLLPANKGKDVKPAWAALPFKYHGVAMGCQMDGMAAGYEHARKAGTTGGSLVQLSTGLALPRVGRSDLVRINADGQIDELKNYLGYGEFEGAQAELRQVRAGAAQLAQLAQPFESKLEVEEERPRSLAQLIENHQNGKFAKHWRDEHPVDLKNPKPGRCSAMVKFTGDDLLTGHTTFEGYNEMLRTWKVVDAPLRFAKAKVLSFSSYPGCISSTDDFVLSDKKVLATETTTNVLKRDALNHFLTKAHYPDAVQFNAAMRLAGSAEELKSRFLNDGQGDALVGTYASEWMFVDYDKFQNRPKKDELLPGTVYIVETGPGKGGRGGEQSALQVDGSDQEGALTVETRKQSQGEVTFYRTTHGSAAVLDASRYLTERLPTGNAHWSSFNEPQLDDIKDIMGYKYDARSGIFEENAGKVKTFDDFLSLMRRNNPSEDGVPPNQAIAARGDLGDWRSLFGGTDTKGMNSELANKMEVMAIAGPTMVVENRCQPFVWDDADLKNAVPGGGMPAKRMMFDWYTMGMGSQTRYKDGCFDAKDRDASPSSNLETKSARKAKADVMAANEAMETMAAIGHPLR